MIDLLVYNTGTSQQNDCDLYIMKIDKIMSNPTDIEQLRKISVG